MIARLSLNRVCPDLLISFSDDDFRNAITAALAGYGGRVVDIRRVPNRGRDIGPFFTAFGQTISKNYDFVGHLNAMKTDGSPVASAGESWYHFILANLLGESSAPMADGILSAMKADASIGMVFPDDPYASSWHAGLGGAESISLRLGVQELLEHDVYPAGGMFWARVVALAPWLALDLVWDDYPEEPLPHDGASPPGIERLLASSLSTGGWTNATANVAGLTR
jgi:lipopolysaccharide biosynthesis protein